MPLRTAEQYREGLRDGRLVYYRGQRVEDVTTHEQLSIGVRHTSLDYEIAEDIERRDLFSWTDEAGQVHSRYY
ncbi:MAG: 4-hydroxyphenylacetate 3-hydroxylase N-terminal domain-containing protein, partial [Candidatus Latescibacterota bacterium]|nr:4-hydroxyphenylacetate 3-hydroxylase N-terminal domain-containing protein [Candidatus Latescibacterota bacterium]